MQALLVNNLQNLKLASTAYRNVSRFVLKTRFLDSVNLAFFQLYLFKVYSDHQDWARAEEACLKAIQTAPKNAKAYDNLAVCLIEQKRWDEALQACEKSINFDAQSPWGYQNYGRAYIGLNHYSKAIYYLEKAIDICPEFEWFYYHIGEALFFNREYEAAIRAFEKFIDFEPSFPWAKYYLGQALLAQGRLEEMLHLYQEARELHPGVCNFGASADYAVFLQMQERRIRQYCEQHELNKEASNSSDIFDILMVAPQPTYPLNSGGGIRMHYQAKALGKKHRLVLVSFIFSPEEFSIVKEMEKYCDLPIVILIGDYLDCDETTPSLARLRSSHQMTKVLTMLQGIKFDIACFDFISTAQYRPFFPDSYTVLGEHNIESEILKRFHDLEKKKKGIKTKFKDSVVAGPFVNAQREVQLLLDYEDINWPKFQMRTVVSEQDKDTLKARCPSSGKTLVVKNGIDTKAVPKLAGLESKRKLLFFGSLNYLPNADGALYLAKEIMPLVWEKCPDLELCIAGRNPPQELLDLDENPLIEVVPNPESIEELAKGCSISLVPLQLGGGTRLKILHAMAMGLPNISTSLGCEGLEAEPGTHLIVQDSPQDFAQAIIELDADPETWRSISHAARALVEEKYDWTNIFDQYTEQLFAEFQQWKKNEQAAIRTFKDCLISPAVAESHLD